MFIVFVICNYKYIGGKLRRNVRHNDFFIDEPICSHLEESSLVFAFDRRVLSSMLSLIAGTEAVQKER